MGIILLEYQPFLYFPNISLFKMAKIVQRGGRFYSSPHCGGFGSLNEWPLVLRFIFPKSTFILRFCQKNGNYYLEFVYFVGLDPGLYGGSYHLPVIQSSKDLTLASKIFSVIRNKVWAFILTVVELVL